MTVSMDYLIGGAYYITFCFLVLTAGELVFATLHIKKSEDESIHVYEKLVIGLIFSVAAFAIYKTSGVTIMWAALLPLMFLEKGQISVDGKSNIKSSIKALCVLFLLYLPVGLYFHLMSQGIADKSVIEGDAIFYDITARMMASTGIESYLHVQEISEAAVVRVPYHYFDLWLLAFFDLPGLMNTWQVMMPAMCAIGMYGIYAYAKSIGASETKAIALMAWIVIAPMGFLHSVHFESRPARSLKYITIFLIFLLFVIYYIKDKKSNFLVLFSVPSLSVVTAPGIFGGFILYQAMQLFFRKEISNHQTVKSKKEWMALMLILMFFLIFYANQKSTTINGLGDFLKSHYNSFSLTALRKIIGQYYSFIFYTTVSLFPYLLFFVFEKKFWQKENFNKHFKLMLAVAAIMFSAMSIAAILWFEPNGYQFYYLFFPFLCALLIPPVLHATLLGGRKYAYSILSVIILFSLGHLAHTKLSNDTFFTSQNNINVHEKNFREKISNLIASESSGEKQKAIKIFTIRNLNYFNRDPYNYYTSVYTPLLFLHLSNRRFDIIQLHAHDLLKIESEYFNTDKNEYTLTYHVERLKKSQGDDFKDALHQSRVLLAVSAHPFFRFLNDIDSPVHIDKARELFVFQNGIAFGYADDCSLFPPHLYQKSKNIITHESTGECFIQL
jgi:hypothetical protein